MPPFEARNNETWKGLCLVETPVRVWTLFFMAMQRRVKMFYLVSQHPVELLFRDGQPLSVCAVHHQNDELQSRRQTSHFSKTHLHKSSATQQEGTWGAKGLTVGSGDCYANSLALNERGWPCLTKDQWHVNVAEMWEAPLKEKASATRVL